MTLEDLRAFRTCELSNVTPLVEREIEEFSGLTICELIGVTPLVNRDVEEFEDIELCSLSNVTPLDDRTIDEYDDLEVCSLSNETELMGGNISSISRIGDLANGISLGSAAAFTAKILFDEHMPYVVTYDEGVKIVFVNTHFIKELRRQFSGEVALEDSEFSPYEETYYSDYQAWIFDEVFYDERLLALEALDYWLVEEVQNNEHPTLSREYTTTHKWRKTTERDE